MNQKSETLLAKLLPIAAILLLCVATGASTYMHHQQQKHNDRLSDEVGRLRDDTRRLDRQVEAIAESLKEKGR